MTDPAVEDLTVEQVKAGLEDGSILLVDVREPNELAAERIPGAIDFPLSAFDPATLPDPEGKRVVFSCRSGKRSVAASKRRRPRGFPTMPIWRAEFWPGRKPASKPKAVDLP